MVANQSKVVFQFRMRGAMRPSMPRSKQLGAERQDRLSMTTTLGSGESPQARRQLRRSRLSNRRQRPSRVQRANTPPSVPKGMSQSSPIARHCMPQKQTHQIAMTALRSAAPASGGFGPDRIGRAPSLAMASSSAGTSSAKASISANASHGPGDVFAGRTVILQESMHRIRQFRPFQGERDLRLQIAYLITAIESTAFVPQTVEGLLT